MSGATMTAVMVDVADLDAMFIDEYRAAFPWRELIDKDIEELRESGGLKGTFLDPDDNIRLSPDGGWPGAGHCVWCYATLGRRRRYCSADCRRAWQRENRLTENEEFGRATARMVRAFGNRVAAGDLAGLAPLAAIMAEAESAMRTAVDGVRNRGVSWSEIGRELGVSKQGARQRWGQP